MNHSLQVEVPPEAAGKRLDKYLAEDLGLFPRSQLETRKCRVLIKEKPQKFGLKFRGGEVLQISWEDLPEVSYEGENLPLQVVFENNQVVVLNKARGMVVHPAHGNPKGTLVQGLLFHCRGLKEAFPDQPLRPGIVHRLDKDTTGIIIAAKDPATLEALGLQFRKKTTRKVYWAILRGKLPHPQGEVVNFLTRDPQNRKRFMNHPSLGKRAHTLYRVVGENRGYTWVELSPLTGRTHQLRVHMAGLGSPILGDPLYGKKDKGFPTAPLMLHALSLEIHIPGVQEPQKFGAPPPEDFLTILRKLGWSPEQAVR